jgi:TPR repeat protein
MKTLFFQFVLTAAFLVAAASSADAASDQALRAAQQGDFTTAYAIWSQEAKAGDPEAAFYLGSMYERGDGVKKSYKNALQWYSKSANAGFAEAQFHIGYLYAQGLGVKKDLHKSIVWTGMAARQGHLQAKANLVEIQEYVAACYFAGCPKDGISRNEIQSYVWHSIAAKNGSSFSKNMVDAGEMLLSTSDVRKAKAIIRECERSGYTKCG